MPTSAQAITTSPITFSGNATDDLSVTNVRVAIRNVTTSQWWNGTGWQTAIFNHEATLTAPGTAATAWSLGWTPPAAGSYAIQVTAVDAVGKVDTSKPWVPFTYAPPSPDQANPNATVSVPTANRNYTLGPITFRGNATDDRSVTNVRVAIRNVTTSQWWNGTGWQTAIFNHEATLTAPGTTATAWSLSWTPPATGSYAIQVTAVDGAGKVDQTKPWIPFRMV